MAKQSQIPVAKTESFLNKLFQAEHLTVKEADGAKIQYDDFFQICCLSKSSKF